jgi:hypothetical protein
VPKILAIFVAFLMAKKSAHTWIRGPGLCVGDNFRDQLGRADADRLAQQVETAGVVEQKIAEQALKSFCCWEICQMKTNRYKTTREKQRENRDVFSSVVLNENGTFVPHDRKGNF